MKVSAIKGFRLVTQQHEELVRFYTAGLGFRKSTSAPVDQDEMYRLGISGHGRRTPLSLGAQQIDLEDYAVPGRAYPPDADAAALIFQHFAVVTTDIETAWQRARDHGAIPISFGGPVTLPDSSGGVTAVKFRDPEGHPLELLQFPQNSDKNWKGEGNLGIDHSAISVSDSAEAIAFYTRMGLKVGNASLNKGPQQDRLDGIAQVTAAVVPMLPHETTPHLELLVYERTRTRNSQVMESNDVAATRIVWASDCTQLLRDPDGHLHELTAWR